MAEDTRNKNPLKILESVGKELITGVLDDLVGKDVLKLEEEEKKKIYDAKLGDKARVLVDSMRQKRHEIYPIKEIKSRTRLALIICNTEFDHLPLRNGAAHDIMGMKGLLEGLGYSVDVEEKLTARDMESVLCRFAAREEHKSSDSTFLVFMSHGILDGICGTMHSDEKPDVLPYDTIFRIFNNRNCLSLKDKPKVIIVQACRGANRGELWVSDSPAALADSSSQSPENLEEDAIYKTHVEKDFIAFCSSTPHNVSWRDITKGSLFITQLITCFQKYSWRCHLEEVFRKVQKSFEKPNVKAQMPTIERLSMTRYFYLFPGN
ncbi:caspase-13 isoform X2 [Eubalaena glacialis]|uniref:caspase-13 isoform X2 n=1 Tax=Eubalaena glacialis TaxID=27606 RepID=UPI002A5A4214|nr:caspase-13 isoform X2 [Eubalaena glacialis]